jgi:outer membrane biosynthesis protein TonB
MYPVSPNQQDSNELAANDVALTASEKAALESRDPGTGDVKVEAPTPAPAPAPAPAPTEAPAPAPAPAPTDAPAPAPAPTPSGDDKAAADAAAATAAAAAVATPTPAPAPTPAPTPIPGGVFTPNLAPTDNRDFAGELKKLKDDYTASIAALEEANEKGKVDDDQLEARRATIDQAYEDGREEVITARTTHNVQSALAKTVADQGWEANYKAFLLVPENALLARSADHRALWEACMKQEVNEAAVKAEVLDDWSLLTRSRDRLLRTIGVAPGAPAPAAAPVAAPAPAPPNRNPPLKDVPPTTSRAPAAPVPSNAGVEELASQGIQDLERHMATLSDTQREALLKQLPGSFVDD